MLQRLAPFASKSFSPALHPVRCLILTPTRELAIQVFESVKAYGKHIPLKPYVVYGGVNINPQIAEMRKGVEILVATKCMVSRSATRGAGGQSGTAHHERTASFGSICHSRTTSGPERASAARPTVRRAIAAVNKATASGAMLNGVNVGTVACVAPKTASARKSPAHSRRDQVARLAADSGGIHFQGA